MGQLIFVTGGARSGKSTYAENLARESGKPVAYIATAIAFDDGMKDRIAKHQAQRPDHWGTIEQYKDFQTIAENGFKSWLKGGKKHGNFFILGQPENGKPILEAEGYATGATLHKLTNRPVALAFDSGNLLSVAIAVKQMFDASTIYVAGDNDRAAFEAGKMKVNVGLEKALEAAQQVGGHTIIPNIQKGEKLSDWNDIAVTKGPTIAKDQIKTALESIKHEQSKVNEIKKTPTREENIPVKDKAQTPWNTEQKVRHRSM